MSWLLSFSALVLFNPWGRDPFDIPKMAAISLISMAYFIRSKSADIGLEVHAIVFSSFMVLASCFSRDMLSSLLGSENMGYGGLVQWFLYFAVFKMSIGRQVSNEIVACLVAVIVYAVFQRQGIDYDHPWKMMDSRAVSTQGSAVWLSMMIGILFPLLLYQESSWQKLALICIGFLGLWAAKSRCGVLAAIVGSAHYLYETREV